MKDMKMGKNFGERPIDFVMACSEKGWRGQTLEEQKANGRMGGLMNRGRKHVWIFEHCSFCKRKQIQVLKDGTRVPCRSLICRRAVGRA